MDLVKRTIAKAISFRILGTIANFAYAWIMTGSVEFATGLIVFQWTVVMLIYYIHERVWEKVKWGHDDGKT